MPIEIFSGERLQLAREFRGMTQKQLGDEVAASTALISLCETGKKKDPAADLVEACGSVLGFEPAFFYGTVHDLFRENECSFRHRRNAPERLKDQIRAHATLIGMVVDRLRSLLKFPPLNVPHVVVSGIEEIEAAAERCREYWKIGVDGPILQVSRLLERAGVIVVPNVVQSTKVDAFSRFGRVTMIFLNQAIPSTSRWVFDIAHECGHLVMHRGVPTGSLETEAEADRFASALLMPRRAFARDFRMAPFSWPHIFDLKKRWCTSAAAIIRRSYDLGLLGAVGYRQSFKYMSAKGWRTNGEPHEPPFQSPELLGIALEALGKKVELTLPALCNELHFTAATFRDVTGVLVPFPASETKLTDVIPFPRMA
ncbi:MAG: ImmA/IrrE family metallo-endopeptidase [Acidobacteriia bacterium]|nr:ImmA/IrrE family metallo-endopeptidase [Terriglobia bacterium]